MVHNGQLFKPLVVMLVLFSFGMTNMLCFKQGNLPFGSVINDTIEHKIISPLTTSL